MGLQRKFSLLLLMIVTLCPAANNCMAAGLRLMTYNVRNGVGLDGIRDHRRIAEAIDDEKPDIVAVQELDSLTGRSGGRDVLAEIAGHAGMRHIYAPAIDYDGGAYGIGILCRETPMAVHRIELPGREEKRALVAAEFNDYVFACTHLSLTEEDRLASLPLICELASASSKPFFLAGDFNAHPDDRFMTELSKDFTLVCESATPSFPADTPDERLDYIAVYNRDAHRVTPVKSRVVTVPTASDHRPVVADILISKPSEEIISIAPYLQNPSSDGVTVIWHTSVPATGVVEYGTDPSHLSSTCHLIDGQADWGKIHKVRLEGLTPGQKYYYKAVSREILNYGAYSKTFGDSAISSISSFTLPGQDDKTFTAVVFNDIHQHAQTFNALCQQIRDEHPDFVIYNGDIIDDPYSYEQASAFLKIINEGIGADSIPSVYIRGNHEIRGPYSIGLRDLLDYAGDKPYSAFNWGDTRFVVLDCGEDKPDSTQVYYGMNDFTRLRQEQAEFLKKELKSKEFKQAKRRVLVHHAPIYGLDVDYTDYNPCLELWGPILRDAPFDISINAHTHNFAFHPRKSRGNNFPVIIGGGYGMDDATVIVIRKSGSDFSIKAINPSGNTIFSQEL